MNISHLSKAAVLACLYNASRPLGLGYLQYDPADMTPSEAEELLTRQKYFDYVKGRVMKINLSTDELDLWLYNLDNGSNAGEIALSKL